MWLATCNLSLSNFVQGFALPTRVLPTHEPFGALQTARTPFHAGVERAELAQGGSVAACAWQGLTLYVYGPTARAYGPVTCVCEHVCAMTCRRQSRSIVALRMRFPLCELVSVVASPFAWGAAYHHRLNGRLAA